MHSASSPSLTPHSRAASSGGLQTFCTIRSGGSSQGSPEWHNETGQLLAAAGLQTRVKRVGGGYREVPYTAAELLEVAASLGMQLRATAEERDRIQRERSSLQGHASESSARQQVMHIEQLRTQIEELRHQQASSSHFQQEYEMLKQEHAKATTQLEEQLQAQHIFAANFRAQLEDLRFAHAEAEAELWCVHAAELNAATVELSNLEAESVALRQVALSALAAELRSRSLGSPAAMPPPETVTRRYSWGSASPTRRPPASPLLRHLREHERETPGASPGSARSAEPATDVTTAARQRLKQRLKQELPEFDAPPPQHPVYTPGAVGTPPPPTISAAAFLSSRLGRLPSSRRTREAHESEAARDGGGASNLEDRRDARRLRYQQLKAALFERKGSKWGIAEHPIND